MLIGDTQGILPNPEVCHSHSVSSLCSVKTQQELYFKCYLRDEMPDVILHFSSFAHDVAIPATKYRGILEKYLALIRDVVPSTTKYMFVSTAPANIKKIGIGHISHRKFELGMDYNQKIAVFNQMLHDVIQDGDRSRTERDLSISTWFDLYHIGLNATKFWMRGSEGVHFDMKWYKTLVQYLFVAL